MSSLQKSHSPYRRESEHLSAEHQLIRHLSAAATLHALKQQARNIIHTDQLHGRPGFALCYICPDCRFGQIVSAFTLAEALAWHGLIVRDGYLEISCHSGHFYKGHWVEDGLESTRSLNCPNREHHLVPGYWVEGKRCQARCRVGITDWVWRPPNPRTFGVLVPWWNR